MKCIIIEDEQPAAQRLQLVLRRVDASIEVVALLDSVADSVKWLKHHTTPDFILLDIHLADGSAFEIFTQIKINAPIIFTTAFDKYALDAFKVMGIDYLLKPVSFEALAQAVKKLKTLQQRAAQQMFDYNKLAKLLQQVNSPYKTRFTGKIGQKVFFIEAKDISFFSADNKIVILSTKDGNRYLVDQTLEQLESLLNPALFFRINRSCIVCITAVEQLKPIIKNRLVAVLKNGAKPEEIIISREKAVQFRNWADR